MKLRVPIPRPPDEPTFSHHDALGLTPFAKGVPKWPRARRRAMPAVTSASTTARLSSRREASADARGVENGGDSRTDTLIDEAAHRPTVVSRTAAGTQRQHVPGLPEHPDQRRQGGLSGARECAAFFAWPLGRDPGGIGVDGEPIAVRGGAAAQARRSITRLTAPALATRPKSAPAKNRHHVGTDANGYPRATRRWPGRPPPDPTRNPHRPAVPRSAPDNTAHRYSRPARSHPAPADRPRQSR
ncbi:hypothetical protein MYXE_21950 [Mycobacterium xenopi]|uniref:Uncharacterized protein n=1 Tax=Mycobacterium xenopi TaxID=1789 RepID=A0AAD1M1F9_MYCXE|nr:hypothetical protein MYXE_21950 [Mycobacterium xenopi]